MTTADSARIAADRAAYYGALLLDPATRMSVEPLLAELSPSDLRDVLLAALAWAGIGQRFAGRQR